MSPRSFVKKSWFFTLNVHLKTTSVVDVSRSYRGVAIVVRIFSEEKCTKLIAVATAKFLHLVLSDKSGRASVESEWISPASSESSLSARRCCGDQHLDRKDKIRRWDASCRIMRHPCLLNSSQCVAKQWELSPSRSARLTLCPRLYCPDNSFQKTGASRKLQRNAEPV